MSRTVVDHDDRLPDAGYICPQCLMVFLTLPEDGGCDCEDEPVVSFISVVVPEPTSFWAYLELMGHGRLAGRVTYREDGTVMVDVPKCTTTTGDEREPWTRILYPSALFSITPCTEEEATKAAGSIDAERIPWRLVHDWMETVPPQPCEPDPGELPF